MAAQDTFKVSKSGVPAIEIAHERKPQTLEEFENLGLVSKYPDDVIDLAYSNWVIKAQAGARQRLDQGQQAVQDYVNSYTYGARTGGAAPRAKLSKEAMAAGGFTEEQLALLRQAGMVIPGAEEAIAEEAAPAENKKPKK